MSESKKFEFIVGSPISESLQEVTKQLLNDPLVAEHIEIISRQFHASFTGELITTIPADNEVAKVMRDFAAQVTQLTFSHPVPIPDFNKKKWKQEFANKCEDLLEAQPDYIRITKEYEQRIIDQFSPEQISAVPEFFLETGLLLAIPELANIVAQVTSFLKSGNSPHLLRLTDEEVSQELDRKAKNAERNGQDVSYVMDQRSFNKPRH